jgi:citrate synthase
MSDQTVKIEFGPNKNNEFPVLKPTLGYDVFDIRNLGRNNFYTFDPGYLSTAACESKITYIDGDEGILLYRGYAIEPLAEHTEYSEIIHLVFYGELPTPAENNALKANLTTEAQVVPGISKVLNGFARDAHPMAMLMALVTALEPIYGKDFKLKDPVMRERAAMQLIAKIPTLAAMCYRYSVNKEFIEPNPELDYASNFLYMMTGETPSPVIAKAMNRILVLHADHEQNASTSTVRLVGSTNVNPFAAVVAGIAALWGPAHGGANEACLNMLKTIGSVERIPEFIARAKDKNDGFKLMGFGHRVYKNRDPRATFMKISYEEVLKETGHNDPLLKVATELEKAALADSYFIDRKLFPNVDFYSGITQTALGIPVSMFTVVFALARMTGWVAQWNEMISDPDYKIGRPRQLYTGYAQRDYVMLEKR